MGCHRRRWSAGGDTRPLLAFDHAGIIACAIRRLRSKLEYTGVGFRFLPTEFTLSDLQTVYEIVLAEPLDKRNFRRKVLQSGLIEETGSTRSGEGRPARLYRLCEDPEPGFRLRRIFP